MILGKKKVEELTIEAVKILPDGTRVPLGIISYYHSNIFKRMLFNIKRIIKKWLQ